MQHGIPTAQKNTAWKNFKENNILMNFTVMLVPHKSSKKPIRFNIPVGFILAAFLLLFVLLCFTTYFAFSSYQLHTVAAENARLNKISTAQEQQLNNLETMANDVLQQLNLLNDSEDAVRSKVGLEPLQESGMGGVDEPVFLQGKQHTDLSLIHEPLGDSYLTQRLGVLYGKLQALKAYSGKQKERVQLLAQELDQYLTYDACVPTGYPLPAGSGSYSSGFGQRVDPFSTGSFETHRGLDICAPYGTPVYAVGGGTVLSAQYDSQYGNVVCIDHGYGYTSIYAHCSKLNAQAGDTVARGDCIAYVGSTGSSTGNHLHLGITFNGSWINPDSMLVFHKK